VPPYDAAAFRDGLFNFTWSADARCDEALKTVQCSAAVLFGWVYFSFPWPRCNASLFSKVIEVP